MNFCACWLNLFADLLRFLVLSLRSKTSLAAENLFLRKQLAFYQERKIRATTARRSNALDAGVAQSLVRLAKRLDRRKTQELSSVGTARASSFSGVGNPNLAGRGFRWTSNI